MVGLLIESLTKDSSIIHFPFLLHMQQHILQNAFSNQNYVLPLNQGDFLYLGSLLTQGDFFYPGSLLTQGDQIPLIGESFMASIFLIIVIHISCLSHQLYVRSSSPY